MTNKKSYSAKQDGPEKIDQNADRKVGKPISQHMIFRPISDKTLYFDLIGGLRIELPRNVVNKLVDNTFSTPFIFFIKK